MKYLAPTLLLCALVSLSNAGCGTRLKPDATHCQDSVDETWHAVGSKWRNSICMDCTCSRCMDQICIRCCPAYLSPKFPDDCVQVFDPEACEYIVHKKDDPSVICRIFGGLK